MSDSRKRKNTSFEFINYTKSTTPNDTRRREEIRSQVRAHATRWQHTQSRARRGAARHITNPRIDVNDAEAQAATATSSLRNSSSFSVLKPDPWRGWFEANADERSASPLPTQHHVNRRAESNTKAAPNISRHQPNEPDAETTLISPNAYNLTTRGLPASFSLGTLSFRTLALRDTQNTIGTNLHAMRLPLSSVMTLYRSICEAQALDFARQYAVAGHQGSWGRFYAFVFTDPVLLATAVLLGVRNQLDVLGRCLDGQTLVGVIHIERFLLNSINDALTDPVRGISDPMLICVALCAAYEIKHGSAACYHVHMQGLVRMVELRGGLVEIGSPDPWIVRLLMWIDINTAKLADCEPYFEGMEHGLGRHPVADTVTFRTKGLGHT